jgi:putrescine importer
MLSSKTGSAGSPGSSKGQLRRVLTLWDLVFYGIVLIQPTAPMPLYGVVAKEARGHVVTTVLIAMVAMLCTGISYGRMARAYPSAGSAYTYVGRELHFGLGFITGWSMAADYMINPIICTIWCSKAAGNIAPEVPFGAWAVFFSVAFTALNLRGIKTTARINEGLVIGMSVVVGFFLVAAFRYVANTGPVSLTRPFYDPDTFSWSAISTGTSIAVLTYIGFDGISTLSEEVQNPRRNILLATVATCLITGFLAAIEVYAAQLVWPDFRSFPDTDTAFVHVAGRAGGMILFQCVNLTLLIATMGSGLGSQLAAARLLYGMGRDNTIPRRFFGYIDSQQGVPRNNILFTGALALAGSFLLTFQLGAELLNFGAFIAFMGVNAAAFMRYFVRDPNRNWKTFVPPVVGFVICLYIWLSLRTTAKVAGFIWLIIGIVYSAKKTGGFRRPLIISDAGRE